MNGVVTPFNEPVFWGGVRGVVGDGCRVEADAVKAAGCATEEDVPFLGLPSVGIPPMAGQPERAAGVEDGP